MTLLISALFLFAFLFAQFGFGSFLIRKSTQHGAKEFNVGVGVKFAVGQIFTGVLLLAFALGSRFNRPLIVILTVTGLLLGIYLARDKNLNHIIKNQNLFLSKVHFFELIALLLILAPQLMRLISRPISDALAYYLVQPKLIALTHQLTSANQFEAFLQSSALIELNSAAVFTFSGEIGMRIYTFVSGIVLFRVIWEICRQFEFDNLTTKLILFFLATSTFLTNTLADGKTDNVSTLWFMAAFSTLVAGLMNGNKHLLILFGVVLGFSILTKLSFAVLIPALLYYFLVTSNRKSSKEIRSGIFHVLVGLSVPIASHILKNQIVFSDALAPFVRQSSESNSQLLSQEWFSPENTLWIITTYPFALLFGQYPMQYGNLTPFAFLGIPMLFAIKNVDRKQRKYLVHLFVMGSITVILWLLIKPSVLAPRYISPAFVFVLIAMGFLARKNIESIRSRAIKALVLILMLGHLSFAATLAKVNYDTSFYLDPQNPESSMYEYVSKLPKDSGLIYLDTFNASMLDNDSLLCSSVTHSFNLAHNSIGRESIWEDLYREGFRYVISDNTTHKVFIGTKKVNESKFGLTSSTQLNFSEKYVLYEITSTDPSMKVKKASCRRP
jgi:hypothetical protein